MGTDRELDGFAICPKCGKDAWTRVINGLLHYYCPYCGAHGKLPKKEPVGDPTPEDDEHLHE